MTFEEFKAVQPQKTSFALFGFPVGHSVSPALHTALFQTYGFDGEFFCVEIAPEQLAEAVCLAKKKLCGICCTIPHKKAIMPFLDEVDPKAREIGAVNVVSFSEGKAIGYNTDIDGFAGALSLLDYKISGKKVLLVGYGGAAAVVGYYTKISGASLTVTGRDEKKGTSFAHAYGGNFLPVDKLIGCYDLLVNATPAGMFPNEAGMPLPKQIVNGCRMVYDTIYNPPSTALLKAASGAKSRTDNGLSMLVMQAAAAQTIWNGHVFSREAVIFVLRRMEADLAAKRIKEKWKKKNIVLIGFMGSGKTTIGRQLAKELSMGFVDMDKEIEVEQNMTITEIFSKIGEPAFRKMETQMAYKLAKRENCIIATGGGAAENKENIRALSETGLVIYLSISPSAVVYRLRRDIKRPLLQAPDRYRRVMELMRLRQPNYHAACHIQVSAGGTMDSVRRRIFRNI